MHEDLVREKVLNFLNWFDSVWNSKESVSLAEVEKLFASNIQFYLNNELMADGIHAYLERLNALRKTCKAVKIKFPPNEIIIQKNKAAVNWEEQFIYHDGKKSNMTNAAFFHFDRDGKIVKFSDIFSGKDPVQ